MTVEQSLLLLEIQRGRRTKDYIDKSDDFFVLESAGYITRTGGTFEWGTTITGDMEIDRIRGSGDVVYVLCQRGGKWKWIKGNNTTNSLEEATPYTEGSGDIAHLIKRLRSHREISNVISVMIMKS